jgi:hypothetical protein
MPDIVINYLVGRTPLTRKQGSFIYKFTRGSEETYGQLLNWLSNKFPDAWRTAYFLWDRPLWDGQQKVDLSYKLWEHFPDVRFVQLLDLPDEIQLYDTAGNHTGIKYAYPDNPMQEIPQATVSKYWLCERKYASLK